MRAATLTAHRRLVWAGLLAFVVATGSAWIPLDPASATYPGSDGLILYSANTSELWTMGSDGSDRRLLTDNGEDGVWSPDGQRIAFRGYTDEPGTPFLNWDIWVMNADGSGRVRITRRYSYEGDVTWSPNGEWLAFSSNRRGRSEVYKKRSTGSGRTIRLTRRTGVRGDVRPEWSPLGDVIAFTRRRPSVWSIRTVPRSGGDTTLVARDLHAPSWSPDGSRILSDTTTYRTMVHMAVDGSDVVEVGDRSGVWLGAISPVWSPQGDRILFTHYEYDEFGEPSSAIYLTAADGGGEPVALVQGVGRNALVRDPDWQPLSP